MKNVNLKSLRLFWTYLATNPCYQPYISKKDISVFDERVDKEGLYFLTVALPELGKALDAFHATTTWDASSLQFKKDEEQIPYFLGNAIKSALKGDSIAVDCVRQLAYTFYKLEGDYDEDLVESFLGQFISADRDLDSSVDTSSDLFIEHVDLMKRIIALVLRDQDPRDIRPSHGSGATACHTKNEDKWHKLRYFPKLDAAFSYPDYFFYSYTHLADELESLVEASESRPMARVCLVPKDSRGPRIISCEPAELMYIQQGLMKKLYHILETHPETAGWINFSDQSINQDLAKEGSLNGDHPLSWATMDLKDASDRVSLDLVRRVFPSDWVECLEACRSEYTLMPDRKTEIKLNKFAPMGSACCFPVEALVFWASAKATMMRRHKMEHKYTKYLQIHLATLSSENEGECYVYGDDIICRAKDCSVIGDDLQLIGLLVNKKKTFDSGPFRESCGGDFHLGVNVTPIRFKTWLEPKSSTCIATGADLANSLIAKFGYWNPCTRMLVHLIEQMVGYRYPVTPLSIPCSIKQPVEVIDATCEQLEIASREFTDLRLTLPACSSSKNDNLYKKRFNKDLQRYEYRILQLHTDLKRFREATWCELLKWELTGGANSVVPDFSPLWMKLQKRAKPGWYAATHAARAKWDWIWLG
jgi:hypothetical protein